MSPAALSSFDQLQKGLDVATLTFDKLYLAQGSLSQFFGSDPFIRVITPQQGIGGTSVQIKRCCFNNPDDKFSVYFNHQKAQNMFVKNCNEITLNAPDNLTSGDVTVVANGLTSNGVPFMLTASPSPTPSPSPQNQALCSDIDFAGDWLWSVAKTPILTLQVKDDGTFTDSEGSSGTWGIWNVHIPGTFWIKYSSYKPGSASTKLKSQVFVKNNGFCDEVKDDTGRNVLQRIIDPTKPSPSPSDVFDWEG